MCGSHFESSVFKIIYVDVYRRCPTGKLDLKGKRFGEFFFVQFAFVARSWPVSLRNLHVHVICSVAPFVGESNKK